MTVKGQLGGASGSITIVNYRPMGGVGSGKGAKLSYEPGPLSIWIGSNSTLDVAAQAFVTFDRFGRRYGVVPNAGSIILGSTGGTGLLCNSLMALISSDAFVIIRPGASLAACGTS